LTEVVWVGMARDWFGLNQHFPFLNPLNHAVLIRHMKKWGQISLYFTKDNSLVTKTK